MATIKYSRTVESVAMSKNPTQIGLIVNSTDGIIHLNAVNAKTGTKTSYLEMQIPVEDLDKVIEVLEAYKNK